MRTVVCLTIGMVLSSVTSATEPRAAAEALDSLGVVTHLDYRDTPYENLARVEAGLRYIGLRRLRDMTPLGAPRPYEQLAQRGFHFDFVIRSEAVNELPRTVAMLEAFLARHPGSIVSLEGLNEILLWPANYRGLSGLAAGRAAQCDLFDLAKASATLAKLPVIALTLGGASAADHDRLGDLSGCADLGNAHIYFDGRPPWASWNFALALARRSTPRLPRSAVTETGYSSAASLPQGVSEDVQAKYLLLLVLEAWRQRMPAVYLYQLVDDRLDARDWSRSLGLFRHDWTPKPAAHALHFLTAALREAGEAAAPANVDLAVVSSVGALRSLALQHAGGTALFLWREQPLWDETARRAVDVGTHAVTLRTSASRAVERDLLSGAARRLRISRGELRVTVGGGPMLIQLSK